MHRNLYLHYRQRKRITCITLFTCRDFQFFISAPRICATNPYCLMKTEVVCDRSEPTITFNLREYNKNIMCSSSSFIHFRMYQFNQISSLQKRFCSYMSYNVRKFQKRYFTRYMKYIKDILYNTSFHLTNLLNKLCTLMRNLFPE